MTPEERAQTDALIAISEKAQEIHRLAIDSLDMFNDPRGMKKRAESLNYELDQLSDFIDELKEAI